MPQQLTCRFLGTFSLNVDGQQAIQFRTGKVRALLAYLLLEAGRPFSRSTLAALLWPEVPDKQARQNLRSALYHLRQGFNSATDQSDGDPAFSLQLLTVSHSDIQFNTDTNVIVQVDVNDFRTLLAACEAHLHTDIASCEPCLSNLEQAADLYHGEFLAGFEFGDAPEFEEWLLLQREMLQQQALLTFERLATAYEGQGDYEQAYIYAARMLHLDQYRETAQRLTMRLLARRGLPDQALAQFAKCRQLLMKDLSEEPAAETIALAEQIRRGELRGGVNERGRRGEDDPSTLPHYYSLTPTHRHDWREMPTVGPFFGRDDEVAQLKQWLAEDRCRLVSILGLGSLGKTSLAAQVVPTLADQFDLIIWRSVLNAPPLGNLLKSILPVLSHQQIGVSPDNLDEQLRLVFDLLQQQRILLILDNLESVLQPDEAGQYRSGYEPYGQLLQEFALRQHQGQLLLTSRERPAGFKRLERDMSQVRSLQLSGLDETAGAQLLVSRGLSGETGDEAALTARYSGNPLALKLVTDTVQDLFLGDLQAFLAEDTLIFDDVRRVLDQQFARLTAFEQDILFWLAIEREPVPVPTLRENLLQPPTGRILLEALNSLQRRSLIERHIDGFALQNVITEYLTDRLVETGALELTSKQPHRLHRHALMKAQTKEHIRQSQIRFILNPIAEQLRASMSLEAVDRLFRRILEMLRGEENDTSGLTASYAPGNLLNLLLHLDIDITGYNFSQLNIRQGYLQGANLPAVNFSGADLNQSMFTDTFGNIYSVAFSSDGAFLAAGTVAGNVRLWRMTDKQPILTLQGSQEAIWSISVSPDGQTIATGSNEKVRLWDVTSGKISRILEGHTLGVRSVAFSPDGRTLASGSEDQTIRLWDTNTWQARQVIEGHTDWIFSIAFSPDSQTLASGSQDKSVCLWDVHTGQRRNIFSGLAGTVRTLAFSPDGKNLASGSDDSIVRLWDVHTAQTCQVFEGHTDVILSIAFHPDGHTLASSGDQSIRLWDIHTAQTRQVFEGHTDSIPSIAFHPDGHTLASSGDQSIRLWDIHTAQTRQVLQGYSNWVLSVAFSPDGQTLASGGQNHRVYLWDVSALGNTSASASPGVNPRALDGHTSWIRSMAFGPDKSDESQRARQILATCGDPTIRIWEIPHDNTKPAPTHLLALDQSDWTGVVFNSDGTLLASTGEDRNIHVWDTETWQIRHILKGHAQDVRGIAFSSDGQTLASGCEGREVRLWNVHTGELLHLLSGHTNWVRSVAISPNDQFLASGSEDKTIRLWNIQTGQLHTILHGHSRWILSVAFSSDGRYLASGSHDKTVRIWDMRAVLSANLSDGNEVALITEQASRILHGHTGRIDTIDFSPEGQLLASGSADETIRLWNVHTGKCLQTLRIPGPYEGLNITDVTGITKAQKTALKALGAVEVG